MVVHLKTHYLADSVVCFVLSTGLRYQAFEQPGPDVQLGVQGLFKAVFFFVTHNICIPVSGFRIPCFSVSLSALLSVKVRFKTKENFELLALKVVTVVYERWSLTRGSACSDLT